jgi:hypothetical protein
VKLDPEGSPPAGGRNAWRAVIAVVEPLGDRTRIQLAPPLPLVAEVTAAGSGFEPGAAVWASIDPADLAAQPG